MDRLNASVGLSMAAGALTLSGSGAIVAMLRLAPVAPSIYRLLFPIIQYYGEAMGPACGWFFYVSRCIGVVGLGWFYALAVVGVICGTVVIASAAAMYKHPGRARRMGAVVVVFSMVGFLGMGGFFAGVIPGVIGGGLAIAAGRPEESSRAKS